MIKYQAGHNSPAKEMKMTEAQIMREVKNGERKIFTADEAKKEDKKFEAFMRANFYGYKSRGRK